MAKEATEKAAIEVAATEAAALAAAEAVTVVAVLEAAAEAVQEEILDLERCIRQSVQIVVRNVKFPSNLQEINLCAVRNASGNSGNPNRIVTELTNKSFI